MEPVAPSAIAAPGGEVPHELTVNEIAEIVGRFAEAADLARRAGFEGVDIHAAHGYLLAQFLSPAANKRCDEYGGNVEKRARLLIEVIAAVRAVVGREFPVWCRINAEEMGIGGGLSLREALETAALVNKAPVDAFSISAFGYGKCDLDHFPRTPGALLPLADAVKRVVNKPVMGVGMITPEVGEQAIREGKIDMVVLGRALLADSEFPNKVLSDRPEEIRPCIHCFLCQDSRRSGGSSIRCSVNAATGREAAYDIRPEGKKAHVLVVGGGPAGMEAARVAALRGHAVTLIEKRGGLGGQLNPAASPPHKEQLAKLNAYFTVQLRRLGVDVRLGTEVTPEMIRDAKADAVILATGASPTVPPVPGIEAATTCDAREVLLGEKTVGQEVIVIGGGMVGCETAEFLVAQGKTVTIIEMLPELAMNMRPSPRKILLRRIAALPITVFTGAQCTKISDGSIEIVDGSGAVRKVKGSIVLAVGAAPDDQLFKFVEGRVRNVQRAGDCIRPRGIAEAIEEGMQMALAIASASAPIRALPM
jgi:thioredoxin reductase